MGRVLLDALQEEIIISTETRDWLLPKLMSEEMEI